MNVSAQILACRYAKAYVDVFDAELQRRDIALFKRAQQFFFEHKQALYFLTLPTISSKDKQAIMKKLFETWHIHASLIKLLDLLIMHKRVLLWPDVLLQIVNYYNEKHNTAELIIESCPELELKDIELLVKIFTRKANKDMLYTYRVCDDLIAGIRARTDNLLWEDSIAKRLRVMRLSLIQSYKG